MKVLLRILKWVGITLVAILLLGFIFFQVYFTTKAAKFQKMAGPEAPSLTIDNYTFRDLNKNGQLDPYEDGRASVEHRVEDLLGQMNIEEKAGLMFNMMIATSNNGKLLDKPDPSNFFSFFIPLNSDLVHGRKMNSFTLMQMGPVDKHVIWHNTIQKEAEKTRLGIPITFGTDPRHAFSNNPAASFFASEFSQWCEPLGFGAIGDSAFVATFGDIARQEYTAIGFRSALHPMADLATEPRWARINGTFGEDAELSKKLTTAYIYGFQGDSIHSQSVATMVKHFPGGGPQKDGWDAHFSYGKDQVYPGNQFDYHQIPFEGAFSANTAQLMPYYGVPVGQIPEEVGFAFSKDIITDLLRGQYGYEGLVCTDFGIISDKPVLQAASWGVETLDTKERVAKTLDAGVDQIGGEALPQLIVELVAEGSITESRIDESVKRILRLKFKLGLFDNPYIDETAYKDILRKPAFVEMGKLSQRKAITLLKNGLEGSPAALPLSSGLKLYVEGMKEEAAAKYGEVVTKPEEADIAIIRLDAPYVPENKGGGFLEGMFHQGDLDFKDPEKSRLLSLTEQVPVIFDIYLDRPAVMPDIAKAATGLFVNFGAEDEAMLEVIFGKFSPEGKLPIELPSSMEAVNAQMEDVPYDSKEPLFPFGFGLSYE